MSIGKHEKLEDIVGDLIANGRSFTSCVVTNERGLVVAAKSSDGSSNQTLAAMVSLLSDAAVRVSGNLGYGHPKTASVRGFGVTVSLHEFKVRDRWFRIGGVLEGDTILKRGLFGRWKHVGAETELVAIAKQIRSILEE
ncbi:MAG: hypothetical protein ACFFFC_16290 [Candidatus Thorarchaeota archaeon]